VLKVLKVLKVPRVLKVLAPSRRIAIRLIRSLPTIRCS